MTSTISREELIKICEDGVVKCADWSDRDSYGAQHQMNDIYALLRAGAEYTTNVENETIWITFKNIENQIGSLSFSLDVDDRDDFYEIEENKDLEMFNAKGAIDWSDNTARGYLPTRKRLNEVDGADWY